jgi:hypothetical protein
MSRRRPTRRRSAGARDPRPLSGGHQQVEIWPDGGWVVRQVTGSAATKPYRCPGCEQVIPMATPHVVAWPAYDGIAHDTRLDERRHWHTGCWRARDRRPAR